MPSKYNKSIVFPQNDEERQALELQHSLRALGKQGIKPGFYSEANRDAWLAVLNKAKEILTPTTPKEPLMTTNNTWTCHKCDNVNSENSDNCLKCQTARIKLTPEQQHLLECQSVAANNSGGVYFPVTSETALKGAWLPYMTEFYALVRKPLVEQINTQTEEIQRLQLKNRELDRQVKELEEKIAFLSPKHPPYPSVGDYIWTRQLGVGHMTPWHKCTVSRVDLAGQYFGVHQWGLPRYFNELGKTWHWEEPKERGAELPKVGDKVWGVAAGDSGTPELGQWCEVKEVFLKDFLLAPYPYARKVSDFGKLWWWEKPQCTSTQ